MSSPISDAKQRALAALFARLGIDEADLHEHFIRASGPGGQKVNKTASAVYLRHVPSGREVKVQTHRSQVLNRFEARRLLASRWAAELDGKASAEATARAKIQRQKRRRSRRSKARSVADKRLHGDKKTSRGRPRSDD